jgi:hypothetical protein
VAATQKVGGVVGRRAMSEWQCGSCLTSHDSHSQRPPHWSRCWSGTALAHVDRIVDSARFVEVYWLIWWCVVGEAPKACE